MQECNMTEHAEEVKYQVNIIKGPYIVICNLASKEWL